ncbi:P-selectin glycoprotein ligand 1 isoform 2-T2 [Odontesthes bonariensis]|uniref:P-selectin glycoprotein ligand 1 isoform X2 n=1 Tax=Odontesthes bonariensis TaxID=219752 RepID=UPI003F58E605
MLPSTKMYVPLLWRVCLLFYVESMTTSIPETRIINITVGPNNTNRQPVTWDLTHKSAEDSTAVAAERKVLPTAATDKTNSSMDGLVLMNTTATAGTSSPTRIASTAEDTDKNQVQLSPTATMASGGAQSSSTGTTASGGAQASSTGTTASGGAQSTVTDTAKHTTDPFHLPSATSSTNMTTPGKTSTDFATTVAVSSQPTSITHPKSTPELPTTTPSEKSTQMTSSFSQSPTLSTATLTANITSEAAPVHGPTRTETSTSTELSSKSHSISTTNALNFTSQFPDKAESSSASTDSPISTSPAGIFNPHAPKRLPVATTRPVAATTEAPTEVPKTSPSNKVQPCSIRGTVKQCLIIIASLAVLATIFIVSTIVLCTKLSAMKYKVRKPQQATEMMCISSLLPERNHVYTRQRNPITNGVLVFPAAGDSDEDGGDNLTLSSFLPENDRYV